MPSFHPGIVFPNYNILFKKYCSVTYLNLGYYREWTDGNQLWVQQVSSAPCTRTDVVHLEELLDTKLQQRQARETGICPVRRELYSQCFGKEAEMLVITHNDVWT